MSERTKSRILVVEDDTDLREAVVDTLLLAKMTCVEADCAEQAITVLKKDLDFDLIVSDVNMGEMSGHDLLLMVRENWPQIPVLLVTAYASVEDSVRAMKDGAVDYLVKPFSPDALLECVARFCHSKPVRSDSPVAEAECSRQLLKLAERVAQSDSTALLMGESGTGKEVLARYIHEHSPRCDGPFVAVNCAAIPENMLEATLFGYEKGAYTGALQSTPGKFEQANGGTILLDEISEMELGLQAKLLRVLQEREVERLGGRKTIKLDVRVVATSNRDMRLEVEEGKFRGDLYFRLSVLPLAWAPLRERQKDILPLAMGLLAKHVQKQHRGSVNLSAEARQALLDYSWPGNVRELDNVMQRALILQSGTHINAADLGLDLDQLYSTTNMAASHNATMSSAIESSLASDSSDTLTDVESGMEESGARLGSDMRRHEFDIIVKTLKQERGSKKNTAQRLGISPRTLRYKMARLRELGFDIESVMA
ncbi:sigma-54-dependent transcriptional regulator [Agaribacterium sp. ZY112]|uniref:sigma-54-dependent transcriptional regulator n=1 Tax=Agaribacterium sp. ZY112 TaxID=3233574 RepID=UPI0035242E5A